MRAVPEAQPSDRCVEKRILALLRAHPQLTFTSLADAIPHHTWHTLFRALSQLQEQQQITLSPLPWDYEILLQSSVEPDQHQHRDKRRTRW